MKTEVFRSIYPSSEKGGGPETYLSFPLRSIFIGGFETFG